MYERNGLKVTVDFDEDPMNPREWDNVGTMICSHRRYTLGDESFNADDYEGWDDLKAHLIADRNAAIVLPLGLYDHSGITMYVGENHDKWDGGQVGFIYCTQEDIDREWDGDREKAENYLRMEVKTYDQYLTGQVFSYIVEDKYGNVIDSCSGFYSEEEAQTEANSAADAYEQQTFEPVHYSAFKDLFKALDINPFEFKKLSDGKVVGHFPNLTGRKSPIDISKLATTLWGKE